MELFVGPILKNNNSWPFFDVQRFERSNKLTVHSVYLFATIALCVRRIFDQQLIKSVLCYSDSRESRVADACDRDKIMTQMRDMFVTIYQTASKIGQTNRSV